MQSLARNGYSAESVQAALHAQSRTWDFTYELLDDTNQHKDWLIEVVTANVKDNNLNPVRRTAFFTMRDTDVIDFGKDRIKPYCRLQMPDGGYAEFPMGVFLLASPIRRLTATGAVYLDVQAHDQSVILRDDLLETRYSLLIGDSYINAVRSLLSHAGITQVALEPSPLTLPYPRDWDPGTSRMDLINALLAAINYNPIYFDSYGTAVARPFVYPWERPIEYTYEDDSQSVIFLKAQQNYELDKVPNVWSFTDSHPDLVLTSTFVNNDPNSPTSVPSRGRRIMSPMSTAKAADQASLDGQVQRQAFYDSSVHKEIEFSTAIMPIHECDDIYNLGISALGETARYQETMWELALQVGTPMRHRAMRVIPLQFPNA